jgi:cell division protein ZapA
LKEAAVDNGQNAPVRAEVEIFGKTYTLASVHSGDYAQEIADDVDRRMAAVAAEMNLADTTKIAMMAAMEIADELLRTRECRQELLLAAKKAADKLKMTVVEAGE